jgi:tellurite resistance-related uncharacterized protein
MSVCPILLITWSLFLILILEQKHTTTLHTRQQLSILTGRLYFNEVMNGHARSFRTNTTMDKATFGLLLQEVIDHGKYTF